jgi:hypothetical protein
MMVTGLFDDFFHFFHPLRHCVFNVVLITFYLSLHTEVSVIRQFLMSYHFDCVRVISVVVGAWDALASCNGAAPSYTCCSFCIHTGNIMTLFTTPDLHSSSLLRITSDSASPHHAYQETGYPTPVCGPLHIDQHNLSNTKGKRRLQWNLE